MYTGRRRIADLARVGREHALAQADVGIGPDRSRHSVLRASRIVVVLGGLAPGVAGRDQRRPASPPLVQVNSAGIQTMSRRSLGASTSMRAMRLERDPVVPAVDDRPRAPGRGARRRRRSIRTARRRALPGTAGAASKALLGAARPPRPPCRRREAAPPRSAARSSRCGSPKTSGVRAPANTSARNSSQRTPRGRCAPSAALPASSSPTTLSWVSARSQCPRRTRSWNRKTRRLAFAGSPRTEFWPLRRGRSARRDGAVRELRRASGSARRLLALSTPSRLVFVGLQRCPSRS